MSVVHDSYARRMSIHGPGLPVSILSPDTEALAFGHSSSSGSPPGPAQELEAAAMLR